MGQEILLQLKNISVNYGGVRALNNVNAAFDEGEIVALMGPNGAGKATMLKAIFGLAPISSGKVFWHNETVRPISYQMVKRGVAFVPQGRRVFGDLAVKENLEIGGFAVKDKKIIQQRIERILDFFPDLKRKLKVKAGTLSGGQQQMLAFARGLMTDPKVLLLDEPSLGLAPRIAKEVFEKIKEINEQRRTTMVVVEHNIKSALEIADRAYILDKGKIAAEGAAEKIAQSDILEKVFMGKIK